MTITEKAAYLKGVADTLGLDETKKDDKLFKVIIDLLSDVTLSVSDLEVNLDELSGQVDEIDEDLGALEGEFYGDDDCTCGCDDCDDGFAEVKCPECGADIEVELSALDSDTPFFCPNCKTQLDFELADEDEDNESDD